MREKIKMLHGIIIALCPRYSINPKFSPSRSVVSPHCYNTPCFERPLIKFIMHLILDHFLTYHLSKLNGPIWRNWWFACCPNEWSFVAVILVLSVFTGLTLCCRYLSDLTSCVLHPQSCTSVSHTRLLYKAMSHWNTMVCHNPSDKVGYSCSSRSQDFEGYNSVWDINSRGWEVDFFFFFFFFHQSI